MAIAGVDATNANFSYPQLPGHGRFIRLLSIDSQETKNGTGPFTCTLVLADLDSKPQFIALSYVWGEDPADKAVNVNGSAFMVRRNLYSFLTTVGEKHYHGSLIFIDAICIDQTNI